MQHPGGLPHLTGLNKTRVDQANRHYAWVALVWPLCHERGVMVTVEDPTPSLFWHGARSCVDQTPRQMIMLPITLLA